MADDIRRSDYGAWAITLAAVIGCVVSIYNYYSQGSGIAGTPGAILVIASTFILFAFGFILGRDMGGRALRVFIAASALLNIAGTAFAGYLLESTTLVVLMAISCLGWIVRLFQGRSTD